MNRRVLISIVLGLLVGWGVWNALSRPAPGPPGSPNETDSAHAPAAPLFEDGTARAGVDFFLDPGPLSLYEDPQIMGSGCAFLDFDQDGKLDIFLVNQAGGAGYAGLDESVQSTAPVAANPVPTSRLYRQQSDGTFVDVTAGSGLDVVGVGMGVAVGDVNNDGFPDICVTYFRATRLFLNKRDGKFVDVSESAGIENSLWGTACAFFDFDRDGWLDLFVSNYSDYHVGRSCRGSNGQREFCPPNPEAGSPHKLFRNLSGTSSGKRLQTIDGQTTNGPTTDESSLRFSDVSLSSGIARRKGLGLGAVAVDFDGDRWPDLFVANDVGPNFLWINRHDGTFQEEAVLRGAAFDLNGHAQANMGIAVGDVDGDGRLDLLVTHLDGEMNALYLNKSAEAFEESAASVGLGMPSLPYTSWGTAFFDVDHDGDLDLAIVNGGIARVAPARTAAGTWKNGGWEKYAEPNQFFLNDGTGHFSEVPQATEPFCLSPERGPEIGRGLAVGDVDNDGDLDILVSNLAGRARLFLNVAEKHGHWLQIRAVLPQAGGRDAYGALVTVRARNRRWVRAVNPEFSYLSSNDPRVHFGLGNVDKLDSISVVWPDGVEELFDGTGVDAQVVLRRGEGHR